MLMQLQAPALDIQLVREGMSEEEPAEALFTLRFTEIQCSLASELEVDVRSDNLLHQTGSSLSAWSCKLPQGHAFLTAESFASIKAVAGGRFHMQCGLQIWTAPFCSKLGPDQAISWQPNPQPPGRSCLANK